MSGRSRREKKLRRLEKLLRRTPPAYLNLVEWLIDRRYARTVGEAQRIILDGRVKAGSHVIGRQSRPTMGSDGTVKDQPVVLPLVPATLRKEIMVIGE